VLRLILLSKPVCRQYNVPGFGKPAIALTQLLPAGNSDLRKKFRALVYQSIVESYQKR
jgi:hypothetical protein